MLFSGDHLAVDAVGEWRADLDQDDGKLGITRNFNWWRVDEQVAAFSPTCTLVIFILELSRMQ